MRLKAISVLVLSLLLAGCPNDTSTGDTADVVNTGRDSGPGLDASRFDTAPDTIADTPADTFADSAADVSPDSSTDAPVDLSEDSPSDTPVDAEADAPSDADLDASFDVKVDVPGDTEADLLPVDVSPDRPPDVPVGCTSVTDIDGNIYGAVEIGSQCWMASNLRTTRAADGSAATRWCCNCDLYGGMYDWSTAMNGSRGVSAQGICPDGWHLPSDADWFALESFLDPTLTNPDYIGFNSTTVGEQLAVGGAYGFDWITAGFTPGGDGCAYEDDRVLYWTSSDHSATQAVSRLFNTAFTGTNRDFREKTYGFYIRCVKD